MIRWNLSQIFKDDLTVEKINKQHKLGQHNEEYMYKYDLH